MYVCFVESHFLSREKTQGKKVLFSQLLNPIYVQVHTHSPHTKVHRFFSSHYKLKISPILSSSNTKRSMILYMYPLLQIYLHTNNIYLHGGNYPLQQDNNNSTRCPLEFSRTLHWKFVIRLANN